MVCTCAFLLFSMITVCAQSDMEDQISITDQDRFIALSQINSSSAGIERQSSGIDRVNSVFIQQIGVNNSVFSNVIAESSDIKIFQSGKDNSVEINESAKVVEKIITQNGNNNAIRDFSFDPNISTNLELIQDGNNLIFERLGSNELSKSLRFRMSGEAQTIIVRSF